MESAKRDSYVDFLRGIAMLLVVLGHTMFGVTENSQHSLIFNIIWSLQIPMFMLISGYVTRYSRKAQTVGNLVALIGRRTLAYLLPWFMWTVLIKGLLLGHRSEIGFKSLFWNMDTGYWFLISIWTISIIFEVSRFLSEKLIKHRRQFVYILLTGTFYAVGFGFLVLIGKFFGLSFFCIKLTLYYMPFYFSGFLFGLLYDKIFSLKYGVMIINIAVAVSAVIWVFFLVRFTLFELSENVGDILLRIIASLSGCVAVFGLAKVFNRESAKASRFLTWCGKNSLQIYTVHGCFLSLLCSAVIPAFWSLRGLFFIALNFLTTVFLTVFCIKILQYNPCLNLILFGKKK